MISASILTPILTPIFPLWTGLKRFKTAFFLSTRQQKAPEIKDFQGFLNMELTETNSNNYRAILDFQRKHHSTSVNTEINPEITDRSYDPDFIIKTIKQQQKSLSDKETRTIITKYQQGKSTYELAKEFGCHRATISKALKDNGIEVTNQCAKKKVLAEMIMQMYSEWYKPQEIGEALGVSADTVRRILHDNNVYIRKSWEYPRKKQ